MYLSNVADVKCVLHKAHKMVLEQNLADKCALAVINF